jgi:hypothetical protein
MHMNVGELALKKPAAGEHVSIIFEGREYTNFEMDRAACKLGHEGLTRNWKLATSRRRQDGGDR